MKKLGYAPLILLVLSTLVLLILFAVKALENQNRVKQFHLTQTAALATQWAEQTLTAVPTETPLPTLTFTPEPTATLAPPTDTPQPTATEKAEAIEGCDVAILIADVTVPDGMEIDPDTKFTKTWKLFNDGTCTWNNFYRLYYVSGARMSGPLSQQLTPIEVPPGASIDISVVLRAPKEPGTYRGYWGLKNTNGVEFGIGPAGKPFYVEIVVVGP